jgi:hypothetical protein
LSLIKEVYAMGMCRPVYPVGCLAAIEAANNKPKALSDAIAKALNTDASLQAIIKAQTGIDYPYNIGNLSTVFSNQAVRDAIIQRTSDVYFSLVK